MMKIEELRIGEWVQERSRITGRLTPPMRIVGLFKGSSADMDCAYLEMDGSEGDPWEAYVKDLVMVEDGKQEE